MEVKVIHPSVKLLMDKPGKDIAKNIEKYGRVCYQSNRKIDKVSYKHFIFNAMLRGHFSLIEHEKVTARIICDRGVSHELVRHRLGSYSQESTRYVKYLDVFPVISPVFWKNNSKQYKAWLSAMENAANTYDDLIKMGSRTEEARSVLPNSLKTEIIVTYNLREWRHFFYLRAQKSSHPQMRQIAIMALDKMQKAIPVVFEDFRINKGRDSATTDLKPAS